MTDTTAAAKQEGASDVADELRDWLEVNWDPEITVGEWWERLGLAGWAAPTLPVNAYGKGLSRSDSVVVQREIANFGALGAPAGLGLLLAAPTIADHATQEQIDVYVREIVTGRKAWCQLFSEPGAGSDLAGLTAKAELDGDEWVVTGQKVWTSLGQTADMGMLLARTAPDAPKHQGITWFAMDMHQPGVELRPLREMTGHAMFNEVFLTEARVPKDAVIGELHLGWAVANSTLAHERSGLGAGASAGGATANPGTVANEFSKRVGDMAGPARAPHADTDRASRRAKRRAPSASQMLANLAQGNGTSVDPLIRQGLVELHILGELGRLNNERLKVTRAAGGDIPGMANLSKLSMSAMVRLQRDLGLQIVGPAGMLHPYRSEQKAAIDEATGNPFLGMVTGTALYAQAPPIYGGTDQIQRNIIGERVLGLPKDPGIDNSLPFSQLPKNA